MSSPKKGESSAGAWKHIQQKTFTRWCNQNLKSRDMHVNDLATDLGDGIMLINLLEILSKKSVGRYNKKVRILQQKHENCETCIKFIQSENMKLVNIGASDIVDGNIKLILGIIWTLILHYQISGLPRFGSGDDSGDAGGSGKGADASLSPKQLLLRWIQSKLPDRNVKNFTTDWNSGVNVAALVESVAPGLCPEWGQMDESTPLENATLAMTRAEEWLGVPQVLHPQDLVNPEIDDLSVMTYLSYFPEAKPKEGMPTFGSPKVPAKKEGKRKKKKKEKKEKKQKKKAKDEKDSTADKSSSSSSSGSGSSSSSSSSSDEEETKEEKIEEKIEEEMEEETDAPVASPSTETTDFKTFIDKRASADVTKKYAEGGNEVVHVVLGSQACDLDSMVSAMAHAYFNEQVNKSFEQPSSFLLPLFNLPRADIALHAEAVQLFSDCNVNTHSIACIDDIDLPALQDQGRLKLTLVDHNVLPPHQRRFIQDVVEILDHHEDHTEGVFDPNLPIWVEPEVGTTATLIAECFLEQMPQALETNPDLARLLLGVILFKTVNLDSEAGLATERDAEAVEKLLNVTGDDREALFSRLRASQFDSAAALSAYDLLRRDYRDADESVGDIRVGASSLPVSLGKFAAKEDAPAALERFSSEHDVGVLLLVCVFMDEGGEPRRQLGIYCRDNGLRGALDGCLREKEELRLKSVEFGVESGIGYDQDDVRVSRRVVLPAVVTALGDIAQRSGGGEMGSWIVVPKEDTRTDFKKFLDDRASVESARQIVEGSSDRVQVVLGSQTGDLDSAVSSLALAYFDEQKSKAYGHSNPTPIPVINAPRSNLELLGDATQLFTDCNVDMLSISCIDDVNLNAPHSKGTLRLTLVTHNALSPAQTEFATDVVGIIDNHADETRDAYGTVKKYIEEGAGSCATLVAERFLEEMPHALEKNPDLVRLLLGVILLETVNLNPEAGRTTEKDRDVAARLGDYVDIDASVVFPQLQSARFNPSALSATDLLRRDYRDGATTPGGLRAGAASIPESLVGFLARADASTALEKFVAKRRLDVLLLVCIFFDDKLNVPRRQLGVYCPNDDLRRELGARLEAQETLALTRVTSTEPHTIVFSQGNVRASRKKTLPLIMNFLKDRAARTDFKMFLDERASVSVAKATAARSDGILVLVLGSPTGDIDSMVSALAQAYFDEQTGVTSPFPVFNAPRDTIRLREDAARLFADCNLDTSSLTCIDDVDPNPAHDRTQLQLTLVTHNALGPDQRRYASDVVAIIDNHRDEALDAYEHVPSKRIEEAGSCATLVAERFLEEIPQALDKNPDLVRLLLGVILLETVNLSPEAGRTTAKDRDVAARLGGYVDVDADVVFPQLQSARFSPADLTAYDLLRRDYKDAVEVPDGVHVGASSITESLASFLRRSDAGAALERFASERGLGVLLLVCIFFDDESRMPRRQLGIYCRDGKLRAKAAACLAEEEVLALSALAAGSADAEAFSQGNVKASRKVVLPLLVAGLKKVEATPEPEPVAELQSWVKVEAEPQPMLESLPPEEEKKEEVEGNFVSFLDERASVRVAKGAVEEGTEAIHVVLGNQACDLDSMVSSMAHAYFLENLNKMSDSPQPALVVPYFNIVRADYPLRVEAHQIFAECDVHPRSISFQDDVNLKQLHDSNRLKVTLVDHNVLGAGQDYLASDVVEIIDHHPDMTEGVYDPDAPRKIELVGSTTTLVAENYLDHMPEVLERNPNLVRLLLATILLDTANLNPEAGRIEPKDGEIAGKLGALIPDTDPDDLFGRMHAAKFHATTLTAYDVLRKDYKFAAESPTTGVKGGTASMSESLSEFLARSDAGSALERFCDERGLGVLLLVCLTFEDDDPKKPRRFMGIYSRDSGLRAKAGDYMVKKGNLELTATTESSAVPDVATYDQANTKGSRKIIMPIFVAFLNGLGVEKETSEPAASPKEGDSREPIPVYSAEEEREEERAYKSVLISGKEQTIDMRLIEPYRGVLQHGGYHGPNRMAIVVFAACRLPDKSTPNYENIMDHLFYYCVSVLETLAADDYIVVYLHGGTPDRNVPKFRWMRRCYPLLDRRIRKSMKQLIMVHCGFWIKTLIRLMSPFISRKFYRKLHFAKTLEHLEAFVDTDQIRFPEPVLEEDSRRGGRPITQAKVKNKNAADEGEKIEAL